MPTPVEPALLHWYTQVEDEASRLTRTAHGRLEALRTRELLSRMLTEQPMRVLDVGGGAGAYAGWLASLGHAVHVIDPVPRHVEVAGALPGVTAAHGDARALTEPDGAFDLCLLLGPLYHLAKHEERLQALREAARVTRPGGGLAAAAIGRYNPLVEFVLAGEFTGPDAETLMHYVRTGENLDTHGFPNRRGHLADELADEAGEAGWGGVRVFGVEGPVAYGADLVAADHADEVLAQAAEVARLVEEDPRVIDTSPHLLAIGTST